MKQLLIFIFLIAFTQACGPDESKQLENELEKIYKSDQEYRAHLSYIHSNMNFRDSLAKEFKVSPNDIEGVLWYKQDSIDKSNIVHIEKIIAKFGYPGKSMVGEPLNETAFYVIQHNPDYIPKYFNLLDSMSRLNEIKRIRFAMLEDRYLANQQLPQKYGTQVHCDFELNETTGEQVDNCYIWEIENPESVNRLRKEVGFTTTIEEYARQFEFEYKHIEIKKNTD